MASGVWTESSAIFPARLMVLWSENIGACSGGFPATLLVFRSLELKFFLGVLDFSAMMQACLPVAGVLYCALPEKRRLVWFRVFSTTFMVAGAGLISLLAC
nr:hypothetical protein Iba_scaffold9903CG0010 [Ipomoea batatas]